VGNAAHYQFFCACSWPGFQKKKRKKKEKKSKFAKVNLEVAL
jgi:hypothetical protein